MGTPKDSEKTRAKIIAAAGQLFAEKGFNAVSVREIARLAETQISALNYHFRGKETLYREVLFAACKQSSFTQEDQDQLLRLAPKDALYLIISEAIKEYKNKSANNWQNALLARESLEAGTVFTDVAKVYLKPQADFVAKIVASVVGKSPTDEHVRFAVITLFGLLDTFGLHDHLVDAIAPGLHNHLSKRKRLEKQLFTLVVTTAKG